MMSFQGIDFSRVRQIVEKVSEKTGYIFVSEDITETIEHTVRKCEIIHKDIEYFYLLLENELEDFQMRAIINFLGMRNMQRKVAIHSV